MGKMPRWGKRGENGVTIFTLGLTRLRQKPTSYGYSLTHSPTVGLNLSIQKVTLGSIVTKLIQLRTFKV
jgi:hypothetical protein